jgi:hypothetical protein
MAKKKTPKEAAPAEPTAHELVGLTIVEVRPMTDAELKGEDWGVNLRHGRPPCLVLSNGTRLYPSSDDEGNDPGALFGVDNMGISIRLRPARSS